MAEYCGGGIGDTLPNTPYNINKLKFPPDINAPPPSYVSTPIQKVVIEGNDVKVVSKLLHPPTPGEVQVMVLFAGFCEGDVMLREGRYPSQKSGSISPGSSLVGRVRVSGPSCTKFQPDDLVVALTGLSSHCSIINIPERYLYAVPPGMSPQQACALIGDWLTGYVMIHRCVNVKQGDRVFIRGLDGGVEFAAMRLAVLQGAEVVGTVKEKDFEVIRQAGGTPSEAINQDWVKEVKKLGGVNAVMDLEGSTSREDGMASLQDSKTGVLLGCFGQGRRGSGGASSSKPSFSSKLFGKSKSLSNNDRSGFTYPYVNKDDKTIATDLHQLFLMCTEGRIQPVIKNVHKLEDIQEAYGNWGKERGVGSVLIQLGNVE